MVSIYRINQFLNSNELDELYPRPYNVLCNWNCNGKSMDENDHTRMLLSVLRYKRPSAVKYKMPILYSFVKTLGIDVNLTGISAGDIRFAEAYKTGQSKSVIDGLILKKDDFAIIIENKICGAVDQPEQIKRYILSIVREENIPLEKIWVVYLTKDGTLHGGLPQKDSYNEEDSDFNDYDIEDRLICVNYRYDIIPWMKKSVLPMVKRSENLLASGIEVYVNYVETDILHNDELSCIRAELLESKILKMLGVTATDPVQKYNGLSSCLDELASEPDSLEKDVVYSFIIDCMDQIVQPICEGFAIATKHFFAQKGVNVDVRTNNLRNGYIQVVPEGWECSGIHYEWIPIKEKDLLERKDHVLMIHIEGKKNTDIKKAFENKFGSEFIKDFHELCDRGLLKSNQRHKTAILASFTDTIPNLIEKGTLEKELAPVYEKAFEYYEVLNQ